MARNLLFSLTPAFRRAYDERREPSKGSREEALIHTIKAWGPSTLGTTHTGGYRQLGAYVQSGGHLERPVRHGDILTEECQQEG